MNPKVLEINKAIDSALGRFNLSDLDNDSRTLVVSHFRLKLESAGKTGGNDGQFGDFNYETR